MQLYILIFAIVLTIIYSVIENNVISDYEKELNELDKLVTWTGEPYTLEDLKKQAKATTQAKYFFKIDHFLNSCK